MSSLFFSFAPYHAIVSLLNVDGKRSQKSPITGLSNPLTSLSLLSVIPKAAAALVALITETLSPLSPLFPLLSRSLFSAVVSVAKEVGDMETTCSAPLSSSYDKVRFLTNIF